MENITEQEFKSFLGEKADYFLDKWKESSATRGMGDGFNWAAFFLTGLWLSYRKMYWIAAIVIGLQGLISFIPLPV